MDSSTSTAEFLKANGLNLEVFAGVDAQFSNTYRLNLTPLTIVIANDGKVEKIWPGDLTANSKAEVATYFGISLDGN